MPKPVTLIPGFGNTKIAITRIAPAPAKKNPATVNLALFSGQRFTDAQGKKWTLQKLPDFNAWLLIGQDRGDGTFDRWFGPATSALGAFGGCFAKFTPAKS